MLACVLTVLHAPSPVDFAFRAILVIFVVAGDEQCLAVLVPARLGFLIWYVTVLNHVQEGVALHEKHDNKRDFGSITSLPPCTLPGLRKGLDLPQLRSS